MILVTGASGQLGRLVIDNLLKTVPADQIIAAVRSPEKVADLAAKGVQVRHADYNQPETLNSAFEGVDKVLLISGSEVGQRVPQHKAVIDAAKACHVSLLAYTSLLHAANSPMLLAKEHLETEQYLEASGVSYVLLRNGWYSENCTASLPIAVQHGVLQSSADEGRFSFAARADYAEAAAKVLTLADQAGKVYELAGDTSYTMAELTQLASEVSEKPIAYNAVSPEEYTQMLVSFGLPEPLANILADSEQGAKKGYLFDDSKQLSTLLGRPTEPLKETIKAALSS